MWGPGIAEHVDVGEVNRGAVAAFQPLYHRDFVAAPEAAAIRCGCKQHDERSVVGECGDDAHPMHIVRRMPRVQLGHRLLFKSRIARMWRLCSYGGCDAPLRNIEDYLYRAFLSRRHYIDFRPPLAGGGERRMYDVELSTGRHRLESGHSMTGRRRVEAVQREKVHNRLRSSYRSIVVGEVER